MPKRGLQALPLTGAEPIQRHREIVHPDLRHDDLPTHCLTATGTGCRDPPPVRTIHWPQSHRQHWPLSILPADHRAFLLTMRNRPWTQLRLASPRSARRAKCDNDVPTRADADDRRGSRRSVIRNELVAHALPMRFRSFVFSGQWLVWKVGHARSGIARLARQRVAACALLTLACALLTLERGRQGLRTWGAGSRGQVAGPVSVARGTPGGDMNMMWASVRSRLWRCRWWRDPSRRVRRQAGIRTWTRPLGSSGLSAEAEAWVMQIEDELRRMEARLRAE